jgi:hypothetical protein
MNPLVVGAVIAAVLAGPPLYSLVQHGQLDGTTAFERWLIVAMACVVGAMYVMKIVKGYEDDWRRQEEEEAREAANEAQAEAKRQAETAQQAAQAANQATKPAGTPGKTDS